MMQELKVLTIAGLFLYTAGCATLDTVLSGETIARFENTDSKNVVKVIAIEDPKELRVWAEVDALYQPWGWEREEADTLSPAQIIFQVEVYHEGSLVFTCAEDALWHSSLRKDALASLRGEPRSGLHLMFVKNHNRGGKQRTHYQKRLFDCAFTPSDAGEYRFVVRRTLIGRFFEVNKCDLLIKTR